jgi:hypothetical protein
MVREPRDDARQNQRQQHQSAKQSFPGKLRAVKRKRRGDAQSQRDRHCRERYLQAVQHGIPDCSIGEQNSIPIQREMLWWKTAYALPIE